MYPPRNSSIRQNPNLIDSAPMVPSQHLPNHQNAPHHHQHEHQQHQPRIAYGTDDISAMTRCVCNLPLADGQLMLQCGSCGFWLHTQCLGIHPQYLPASFACTFCTSIHGSNGVSFGNTNDIAAGQRGWDVAATVR